MTTEEAANYLVQKLISFEETPQVAALIEAMDGTAPEQHDPETEQALDHLEQSGAMRPDQRAMVRQRMAQTLKQHGGDVQAANRSVQADNKHLYRQIDREHGQQLADPRLSPYWRKISQFYRRK